MSGSATTSPIDTKIGRLICATVGLRLRRELDLNDEALPRSLALQLAEIQRREAED